MTRLTAIPALVALHLAAVPVAAQTSNAQAAEAGPATLSIALDSLAPVDGACRLTFVARNGLAADISALVIEAVAFGADGGVERIALFDFGTLPVDRLRVRQFDLPGLSCDAVGSVLVNGVQGCVGEGLDAAHCAAAITVSSRAGVELLG